MNLIVYTDDAGKMFAQKTVNFTGNLTKATDKLALHQLTVNS